MFVASLYIPCFVMFCVFLYGPFCHGAHTLDLSTLFTTFFLWTSLPFIFLKIHNQFKTEITFLLQIHWWCLKINCKLLLLLKLLLVIFKTNMYYSQPIKLLIINSKSCSTKNCPFVWYLVYKLFKLMLKSTVKKIMKTLGLTYFGLYITPLKL